MTDKPNLNKVFDKIRKHDGHALFLDLEFFQDKHDDKTNQRMAQIAGTVLGISTDQLSFNCYVFDPDNMDDATQLKFLKDHNITYQQALDHSAENIMEQVKDFLDRNKIDMVISWGHVLDFNVLDKEGFSDIIPAQMETIDLERILATTNGQNPDVSLNLERFCNLLNFQNTGKWHNAFDDAVMISKICNLYLNVLTKSLNSDHDKLSDESITPTTSDVDNCQGNEAPTLGSDNDDGESISICEDQFDV